MAQLTLDRVTKSYDQLQVIHGIDLYIEDGELVVFVGPSGCGKSTLLRMIAGLEEISGGQIAIDGKGVDHLGPSERGIAMVFQSYALYPHKDVYGNMAFALRHAGIDRRIIDERVRSAAAVLGLEPLLKRRPNALSGGQRQRVAIGRAIVRDPKLFLFDEPLSNLDASLRVQMRVEILKLHRRLKSTMIYVTHDQVEAMTLADRIVVMRDGRIEQIGTPLDLYRRPANMFVAGFIGSPEMNLLEATVDVVDQGRFRAKLAGGQVIDLGGSLPAGERQRMHVGIRPEHLEIVAAESAGIRGVVQIVERLGGETLIHVNVENVGDIVVSADGGIEISHGEPVGLLPEPDQIHLFGVDGKTRDRVPAPGASL